MDIKNYLIDFSLSHYCGRNAEAIIDHFFLFKFFNDKLLSYIMLSSKIRVISYYHLLISENFYLDLRREWKLVNIVLVLIQIWKVRRQKLEGLWDLADL